MDGGNINNRFQMQDGHRQNQGDNGDVLPPLFDPILEHYHSLPPISRAWFTLSVITTFLHTVEVFPTSQLLFVWDKMLPPKLELWRVITSFVWAGPGTLADFPVLLLLYSIAMVVPSYEKDPHEAGKIESFEEDMTANNNQNNQNRRPSRQRRIIRLRRRKHPQSDCLFAFLVCAFLILLTYLLLIETPFLAVLLSLSPFAPPLLSINYAHHPILIPVFTRTLLYAIITLHSLQNPDQQVNINFFPVPGRYVPLFHVVFGVLMGYRVEETLAGIAVGWLYSCLIDEEGRLAQILGKKRAIYTPNWLVEWMGDGNETQVIENVIVYHRDQDAVMLEPGANVLHYAASIGDLSLLRHQEALIISQGGSNASLKAKFNQRDRNGWQPIHEAARGGHIPVLKFILEIGDDQEFEASANGLTGVEERSTDITDNTNHNGVRRLQKKRFGVDINARTHFGRGYTALKLIEDEHGVDCEGAELLRSAGAVR